MDTKAIASDILKLAKSLVAGPTAFNIIVKVTGGSLDVVVTGENLFSISRVTEKIADEVDSYGGSVGVQGGREQKSVERVIPDDWYYSGFSVTSFADSPDKNILKVLKKEAQRRGYGFHLGKGSWPRVAR